MNIVKIALFGPGYGSNIWPYLNWFHTEKEYQVSFYYQGKNDFKNDFPLNGHFNIQKISGWFTFLNNIRNYDIIWVMGGNRLIYILPILFLFKKSRTTTILNNYGEKLPSRAAKSKLLKYLLNRFNIILCNWFGTGKMFDSLRLSNQTWVRPIGGSRKYLEIDKQPNSAMDNILKRISNDTYNFFYPKSFLPICRHDLIIKAAAQLIKEGISNFRVYFWHGNSTDYTRYNDIIELCNSLGVTNHVIILEKDTFFSIEQMNLLWTKMHCGLQITERDQFSIVITEIILNLKDIIISDIEAYSYIEKYFGIKIPLTPISLPEIYTAMKQAITNGRLANDEEKKIRKDVFTSKFLFEDQFSKIIKEVVHFKKP